MERQSTSKISSRALSETRNRVASVPVLREKQVPRLKGTIVLGVFVLLFGTLTVTSFLQKSPTVDEPVYLLAGYSYLRWGDFRVNPEHPPLAKLLAGLPLLAFEVKDPRPSGPSWDLIPSQGPWAPYTANVAGQMLFVDNDAETLFFYAKLMMIAVGILLGLFVYRWSKELFGGAAAIVSLFIYGLDPNILAHGQLVETDLPFTTFFFIGTYFFWRLLNQINWSNLILSALFFGLMANTKYAYPVVFVIWGILVLLKVLSSKPQRCAIGKARDLYGYKEKAVLLAGVLGGVFAVGYILIWAVYGFRFDAIPGGDLHLPMAQEMPGNPILQAFVSFLVKYKLFPEAWIYGQLHVYNNLKRDTYLLGQYSDQGFWLYFPVAFAVKTPLPTLLLLIGTLAMWIYKRSERRPELCLLVPVAVYFSFAVLSRINIGLRHILPIYPFLFVMIGGTVAELWRDGARIKKGSVIFLGLWYVWSSISIYPHYLAFFNELVGGPKNGHKVLLDSNLDWGQDLKGLKRWMDNKGVKKIDFLYFGKADPQYYGIDAFYLPGSWVVRDSLNNEVPSYLAVSVTHLYGPDLFLTGQEKEILKSFELGEPVANIGYSILVYEVHRLNPQIYYNMGFTLASRGQLDKAVELFREAVRLQPEFAEAHASLARALVLQGKREEAVQHYQEALRIIKSRPEAGTSR